MNTKVSAGVAVFIRNRRGEILFTRCNKVNLPGKWSIPGGKVQYGEMPEDAVARYALSEAGVRISEACEPNTATGYTYPNGEHHAILFYCGVVWVADETKKAHRDYEIAWLARDDFPAYEDMLPPLDAAIKRMIHMCIV